MKNVRNILYMLQVCSRCCRWMTMAFPRSCVALQHSVPYGRRWSKYSRASHKGLIHISSYCQVCIAGLENRGRMGNFRVQVAWTAAMCSA